MLPSTYFTRTPFQNWTRRSSELLGSVELDVDWRVDVAAMRAQLNRVLEETELWDGRAAVLQVTDAVAGLVRVRALVTATDAATITALTVAVALGLSVGGGTSVSVSGGGAIAFNGIVTRTKASIERSNLGTDVDGDGTLDTGDNYVGAVTVGATSTSTIRAFVAAVSANAAVGNNAVGVAAVSGGVGRRCESSQR